MIITCKECESSFQVDDRLIQENGSKVRCSKCSAVFVVYPPALDAGATPESDRGSESDDLELDLGLDLSDLELDMEDETESGPESAADGQDLELNLNLGEESPDTAAVAAPADEAGGELDLSDLEEIIESDKAADSQPASGDESPELDLDLDFQVGEDGQTADAASAAGADDELDLSDLDEMLESDEAPAAEAGSEDDAEELDLEFDVGDAMTADDDMLDIEQMLEDGDDSAQQNDTSTGGTEDLDLALEMDSGAGDIESDLDLDLEGELGEQKELFETSAADGGELLASNLLDDEDEDFLEEVGDEGPEFSNGAGAVTGSAISDDFATDESTETGDYGQTDVLPDEGDKAPATGAPRAPKVRSKKPALVAVLVLIFVIGILIIPRMLGIKIPYVSDIKIPYLSDVDMKIPFLSDLINPEKQDVAGNLKINPLGRTINGRYVENSKAGRLFVIQGKIKNEYDHPRSFIKVTGKLFQKGGKVVKTATVYCGNVLSGVELNAMNMTGIKRRLKNKFGDRRSNVKVAKGRILPFMIVFDQLPRNLDEFSIEVTGSSI
jgi:predicted Zn finger-like uncharacterized protein